MTDSAGQMENYNAAIANATAASDAAIMETIALENEQKLLAATVGDNSVEAFNAYQTAMQHAESAADAAMMTEVKHRAELERVAAAATAAAHAHLDMSMSMTSQMRSTEQAAEDFAASREQAEEKHQENLAKLQKRGAARAVKFNVDAEKEKLAALHDSLKLQEMRQAEFTDKTKESTKLAKEMQIEKLQEQIAEQTALLDNYYAGRLVQQGENVSGLLAKEQERYAAEIAMLEENRVAQEAAQRESLGRMVLQQFEAWAQLKGLTAEQALEMRLAISEEYGLIDEKASAVIRNQVQGWERYASSANVSATEVVQQAARVTEAIESIPSNKTINIDVVFSKRGAGRAAAEQARGAALPGMDARDPFAEMQHGGFSAGGLTLVGDAGPEMVHLPPGARVRNNTQTMYDQRTFNYNVQGAGAAGILAQQQRAATRARFARTM
jgi:hypothetical protein